MSLRSKLAVIVLVVMAGLLLLDAAILVKVVMPGLQAVESATAERHVRSLRQALRREVEALGMLGAEWAEADGIHDLAVGAAGGSEPIRLPTPFVRTGAHVFMILGRDGRALFAQLRDEGGPMTLAELPSTGLPPGHALLRNDAGHGALGGFYATERGPIMLSARPILPGRDDGPSIGTLLVGRLLTPALIGVLADIAQSRIDIWPLSALPPAEAPMAARLLAGEPVATTAAAADRLHVYFRLDDVFGAPLALVRATMARDLVAGGRQTMLLALSLGAAAGVVLLVVFLALFQHLVGRPLARLDSHVADLRSTGDLSARLAPSGSDEIAALAQTFDDLVAGLARAAGERERARSRLLDGIENIADGFALWDAEDRLVLSNSRFARLFAGPTNLIRPGMLFVEAVRDTAAAGLTDPGPQDLESWVTRRLAEHRACLPASLRLSDGRWIEVRESRTREGGIVGIYADITERKRSEDRLREMLGELARSNAELEQFAYVASHDLQEPLRMVASFTQLLERRYRNRLDGDADEFIRYAVEGAKRMQAQINGLLAFSRVDRKGGPFRPADANAALATAVANLHAAISETGACIAAARLPTVMADPVQLAQLFQNLVGNAIKYHRPDTIPNVAVDAIEEDGRWRVAVSDNGIGIDGRFYDRIFMIFQRLHTREEYPGTGIGLAICKKIVERHGGRIWVESRPGAGSTFCFTLPAAGRGETAPESAMTALD